VYYDFADQTRSQEFVMGREGTLAEFWRRFLQPPEAIGGLEAKALGDFCNFFNKNNAFIAYYGQNSYFKAITHQL